MLTTEESALRHVALLVARGAPTLEVFAAAAEQVARIFDRPWVGIMRYDSADSFVVLATWGEHPFPVGSRWPLDGPSTFEAVLRTGRPAAVSDYTGLPGTVAGAAREAGIVGGFGAPIFVDGVTWGVIAVPATRVAPVPEGAETRLSIFTELVATAISNAEARTALALLAEEQAALRRVATLVAAQAAPDDIHAAVAEEVALLLAAHRCAVGRYEPDETLTVTGYWSMDGTDLPVGTQIPLEGDVVTATVRQSGRPIRIDSFEDLSGPVVDYAREVGPLPPSTVGAPIVVDGQAWGIIFVSSMTDPLPGNAESRVMLFTELVATAIVNADSRSALRELAEEQAALRRVAELVAKESALADVLAGVAEEFANVLGDVEWALARDDGDGMATALAVSDGNPTAAGTRVPIDVGSAYGRAIIEAQPARIDDYFAVAGDIGRIARKQGVHAAVSVPIVVRGRTWGAMSVGWRKPYALPSDTEAVVARFSDLIATAIANAETRDALALLAEEQAALRRVATLVADGTGPEGVFPAVAAEVEAMFGADISAIVRFEEDGVATVLGDVGGPHASGKRVTLDPGYVVDRVREAHRSARFDTDDPTATEMPSLVRAVGIRSAVASPIVVEGEVWGAITAASVEGPLAPGAERQLSEFTELVATAVANTEARQALERVAAEQAALRRVATLVAVEASQDEIFNAVAEGVAGALGEELRLVRLDGDYAVVVAGSEGPHIDVLPVGTRLPVGGNNALSRVFRTGEPTRIDDYSKASGPIAEAVQAKGLRSIVATPVIVEGRTWGAMIVGTFSEKPVPAGTEDRLRQFAELMATDIANTEARAELVASRARIVAAGDEARRRIERNLHDGTQQRLIALGLDLQRARAAIPADLSDTHFALAGVEQDLEAVLGDLRELSHGLHPPLLSRLGLGPSLQALARRSPIPVQVDVHLPERPAEPLETAVYYVVSEALTNAIKHSRASEIVVTIRSAPGYLHATIVDDGLGGADPSRGSGLTGLVDRVNALGGRFACESPSSCGTRISVDLPVDPAAS